MKKFCAFLCVLALCLWAALPTGVALAQGEPQLVLQPQAQPQPGDQPDGQAVSVGLRPEIYTTSHSAMATQRRVQANLPAAYRLMDDGLVTPVRDQGIYGTCWAFASIASAESFILGNGLAASPDLSEWQLAYYTYMGQNGMPGFDRRTSGSVFNEGGNAAMAAALMARGSSPVEEALAPYGGGTPDSSLRPSWDLRQWGIYHTASEWKMALRSRGALTIAYYASSSAANYNAATASYYCKSPEAANHAVTLVGWDDNYPASNFATEPDVNGAWIVKNSWGAQWGNGGYFYLSYADQSLEKVATSFELVSQPTEEKEYTYDELGMISAVGFACGNIPLGYGWMKATYTAQRDESVSAVGMFLCADNSTYSIQVSTPSGLSAAQTGTAPTAGYLRIPLDKTVTVAADQTFEIIVKVSNASTSFPLPVEMQFGGYSSQARFGSGQSAFSSDGSTWIDGASWGCDACLDAFTMPADTVAAAPAATVTPAPMPAPSQPAPPAAITILPYSTAPSLGPVAVRATTSGGILDEDSHTFTSNGSFTFVARNADGACSSATVTISNIDRDAPAIAAARAGQTIADGGWTNGAVTLSVSDANLASRSLSHNGIAVAWPRGGIVSTEGVYTVSAADALGNRSTLRIGIDTVAPALSAKAYGRAVKPGSMVKTNVTLSGSDAHLAARTLLCNGKAVAWPANGVVKADGVYQARLSDWAGNTASVTFTIDRTAPKITATSRAGKALPRNRTASGAVHVSISDATLRLVSVKRNGKTMAWPTNGVFSAKGTYTLNARDRAGYSASYTFKIK